MLGGLIAMVAAFTAFAGSPFRRAEAKPKAHPIEAIPFGFGINPPVYNCSFLVREAPQPGRDYAERVLVEYGYPAVQSVLRLAVEDYKNLDGKVLVIEVKVVEVS